MSDTAAPSGILFVDKPAGLTSHGVVARVRRWYGTKKVGHAGTLDPMATGLLVLGLGRGTKLLTHLVGADKVYEATIRLGASTPTDDADSQPDRHADPAAVAALGDAQIVAAMGPLTGEIEQVPSAVSAIKVDGRRAYARVRAGEEVALRARTVCVARFEPVAPVRRGPGWADIDVVVACSSGTYVRALARDLGAALGVGGHLTALRRTRVAGWDVAAAVPLPADTDAVPAPPLTDLAAVAARLMPALEVDAASARALMQGKLVALPAAPAVLAVTHGGRLIAIAEPRGERFKIATGIALEPPDATD
ncbi:tRNA pseudouridine(55) synthase TruB [Brevibacterium sp. BRM-1]|uniref:tRNA pseudouridine(55) synthase TruB n=1 Tax=Brevibacterium sp. BRM-1 TaxID=2999062 RepID=UPI00227F3DEB|nr:tRNA pseudouridine(55) synthase TruB [Brevibacterium sp. BRM-1]WAL41247.1 tRNA pseudouridine(55) synthase TruB [Brevibacterium sp. BRM-1]